MCRLLGTLGGGGGQRAFSRERLEQGREGEVQGRGCGRLSPMALWPPESHLPPCPVALLIVAGGALSATSAYVWGTLQL